MSESDFQSACETIIGEQQRRGPNKNEFLIRLLADAIRCSRELSKLSMREAFERDPELIALRVRAETAEARIKELEQRINALEDVAAALDKRRNEA